MLAVCEAAIRRKFNGEGRILEENGIRNDGYPGLLPWLVTEGSAVDTSRKQRQQNSTN